MTMNWVENFSKTLVEKLGQKKGESFVKRYANSFKSNYHDRFDAESAYKDVLNIEEVAKTGKPSTYLYEPEKKDGNKVCFKLYYPRESAVLSDVIPMLEHMSFKILTEIPYQCSFQDAKETDDIKSVWVHNFTMVRMDKSKVDVEKIRDDFQEAFKKVMDGDVDDDGFNCLILVAGLNWREVSIVRAYARYLRQAGITLSQDYINSALAANPEITKMLVDYFESKFNPAASVRKTSAAKIAEIDAKIKAALDNVTSAEEDRIIRYIVNLLECTLRTNFYQSKAKNYISFKLNSKEIYDLPLPRPMVEIFVYSPRMEGIHLRGGKVARGGIRWSDRHEDYRTEILGLVKAQMVKNVVIVPTGSKGGFVCKKMPYNGTREEILAEGIECYKTLMRGILDLTDNIDLKNDKIVPPEDVVRYDEDDPYLVVAADKGTASFSDIANGVSQEYGFWLGDAFASGGSVGFSHKDMAITAKGAWECVKRHFREIGVNIQTTDFQVAGVGDMSGDVFGNGMLLSEHIKLVAAFDHRNIFIDPNPDPKKSFKERERMFALPRSSWEDYNQELISEGGGIFSRKAKSITLSKEIKNLLNIKESSLTPNNLIKAILRSNIDLLWFGGIGTYVKSSAQRDSDVGDRSNDACRINANEIKAKVVGEGANLGMTQKARIEYCLNGGRCNTDAIDNSAGVNCSDIEVNFKILLNDIISSGKMDIKGRNKLLVELTSDVSKLSMRANQLQGQALSLMLAQGTSIMSEQKDLFKFLEEDGLLNRDVEFLPSNDEMDDRFSKGQGLTRPELSILMPYSKIWLYKQIIESDLPDDPMLTERALFNYFPKQIREKYGEFIKRHRLRREIIAKQITNTLINRVGGTFVTSLMEKTGMPPSMIARAFLVAVISFSINDIWDSIEALDNKVDAKVQTMMLIEINRILERITQWILRRGPAKIDLTLVTKEFKNNVDDVAASIDAALAAVNDSYIKDFAKIYMDQGVPEILSRRVASIPLLSSGLDIGQLSRKYGVPIEIVCSIYFAIGKDFDLRWMRDSLRKDVFIDSHWKHLAVFGIEESLFAQQRSIVARILEYLGKDIVKLAKKDPSFEGAINSWKTEHEYIVKRISKVIRDIKASNKVDLAMMMVMTRNLRALSEPRLL
ncbi:MAG: NAD-glutamate dehydrogenase [Alphaproteobacteria bacterium]